MKNSRQWDVSTSEEDNYWVTAFGKESVPISSVPPSQGLEPEPNDEGYLWPHRRGQYCLDGTAIRKKKNLHPNEAKPSVYP